MAELHLHAFRSDHPEDLCGWQLRIVVDGEDLTARGCGLDPDELLPDGLLATDEPRHQLLVRCGCSDKGCGSASAVITREGDTIRWTDWESTLGGAALPAMVFPAAAYDAEVARAHRERSWEPPARRTAREARAFLTPEAVEAFQQLGLRQPEVVTTQRDHVEVWFRVGEMEAGHWQVMVDVTGTEPPQVVAELLQQPPQTWSRASWLGNDRVAMRRPPPMAGPDWRPFRLG